MILHKSYVEMSYSELRSILIRYNFVLDACKAFNGTDHPKSKDKFAENFIQYVIEVENEKTKEALLPLESEGMSDS